MPPQRDEAEVERARQDPRRLLGSYVLLEELGRGGMGVVYRAWDQRLRRTVALKTILPGAGATPTAVLRFQREAEAVARLRHPNIVAVHEVGTAQGRQFIAMDFIAGGTLERRIRAAPGPERLSLTKALEALRDVARAVQYAHEQGVVHRDLKPANILLDAHGRAFVLDFGLALVRGEATLTKGNTGVGTPAYMAPEQAAGEGARGDERSDVYSLGATLYFVLTGRPPFEGETDYNILAALITKDPVPPSARNPRARGDLETICLRALEKAPERRYASAADFARDLELYLAGEPIAARPISGYERLVRRARRNKLATALAVAVVVSVLSGLGVGVRLVADRRAEEARRAQEATEHQRALEAEQRETLRTLDLATARLAQAFLQASTRAVEDERHAEGVLLAAHALADESLRDDGAPGHARALREIAVALERARQGPWRGIETIAGAGEFTECFAPSPDGTTIAACFSGASGPRLCTFPVTDGRAELAVAAPPSVMRTVAWSPDGRRLAVGFENGAVWVVNPVSGRPVAEVSGVRPREATGVAWQPGAGRLAAAWADGRIVVATAEGADPVELPAIAEGAEVDAVAWSLDGSRLAVGTRGREVALFAVEGGAFRIAQRVPVGGQVTALAFVVDPERTDGPGRLAVGTREGAVRLVTLSPFEVHDLTGHRAAVVALAASPDGALLASSSRHDETVRLWDARTGAIAAVRGVPSAGQLAFAPDGQTLLVGSDGVGRWDVSAARSGLGHGRVGAAWKVALAPGGGAVASLGVDGALELRTRAGALAGFVPADRGLGCAVAFDGSGKRLASSRADGVLAFFDLGTRRGGQVLSPTPVYGIAYAPSGERVVTGGQALEGRPNVCLWNAATGTRERAWRGHDANVNAVAWSPDGKVLATGAQEGLVKLWDADSAVEIGRLDCGLGTGPTAFAWEPGGRTLLIAAQAWNVYLWDTTHPERDALRFPLAAPRLSTFPNAGAVSPGAELLAVGIGPYAVLYSRTGERLALLPQPGRVSDLEFLGEGAALELLVATFDARVVSWNVRRILSPELGNESVKDPEKRRTLAAAFVRAIERATRLHVSEDTLEIQSGDRSGG